MEQNGKEPTPFQLILQKLGKKNTVVQDTMTKLRAEGVKISQSALYQAVAGRSHRKEVVEAFLEVAEAEFARRREVDERARQLVAQA